MKDQRTLGKLPTAITFRAFACLLFFVLFAPIPELVHADHCELEACQICTLSAGNDAVPGTQFALTRPALLSEAATSKPPSFYTQAIDVLRSRGPPPI